MSDEPRTSEPAPGDGSVDASMAPSLARAAAAERRLRAALHQLKRRSEHVAEEVQSIALPTRVVGAAVVAGIGAMLLVVAVRAVMRRSRSRAPRSVRGRVPRSLGAELATRAALGAAGVVGARLVSDVVVPAIAWRLT
jgi:hypothetical protein